MPTVQSGKRPGRTRGRPADQATADGLVTIYIESQGETEVEEVQTITNAGTSGHYFVKHDVSMSLPLDWDATIGAIEGVINLMYDVSDVTVAGTPAEWTATFENNQGPQPLLEFKQNGLYGGAISSVLTTAGVLGDSEVVDVTVNGDTGVYTLTFGGQETGDLDIDDNAAAVETALELLSSITAVTVTGSGTRKDPFKVLFVTPSVAVGAITEDFSGLENTIVDADRASAPNSDRE